MIKEHDCIVLTASGGLPPHTFDLIPGSSLPSGLTLSAAGLISGTPVGPAGPVTFTVRATDSLPVISLMGTRTYTVEVQDPPLVITTLSLPSGVVGVSYLQTITSTGGRPPIT